MEEAMFALVVCSSTLLLLWFFKALYELWWHPMMISKFFREQGISGPPYALFFGNVLEYLRMREMASLKPMEFSHKVVSRVMPFDYQAVRNYGKVYLSWHGSSPRVVVIDPALAKEVLANRFGDYTKPRIKPLTKLFLTGVLMYDGEKALKHRKIVNTAFHQEKLKLMFPAMQTCCAELVGKWEELASEKSCEVDVWPFIKILTADAISRAAFGSSYREGQRIFHLQAEMGNLCFEKSIYTYIPGLSFLPTKRLNRMHEIHREMTRMLQDMISKRETAMRAGEASKKDLLGVMMESNFKEIDEGGNAKNVGLSINEIIEECKLFYLAGQETTASLLVWTMVVLAMHTDWQEKAREEIMQVLGSKEPDFDSLSNLKILTMILQEVLRLYPPVNWIERRTDRTTKLGQYVLPPDVDIILPTLLIQHDPSLWGEDADEFKPERFVEGVPKVTQDRLVYFPLGWGPRLCIGHVFAMIESKLMVSSVLQKFRLELSPTYVHAPYLVLSNVPQHGAQIIVHKL